MGHYPSESILNVIKNFNIDTSPVKELISIMEGEWEFADVGYFNLRKTKKKVYLQLHTCGWSGNEDLMEAFKKVRWIGFFWLKSERGGHFWYEFPTVVYENGIKGMKKNVRV